MVIEWNGGGLKDADLGKFIQEYRILGMVQIVELFVFYFDIYYFLKGVEKCCHYLFCVELLYVGCESKYILLHKVNSTCFIKLVYITW